MANSSSQPTETTSSPSKCQEEAVVKKDGVDRISHLPECLLCHILSFLPTKNVVKTSILSRRWKTLWTFVPSLDLDINYIAVHPFIFSEFVSKIVALHKAPYIKFHLNLYHPYNPSRVDTWVNTAVSPNLEDFFLCIHRDDTDFDLYTGKYFQLPRSFFSCKNLMVLKLIGPIILNVPSYVWFPRLKFLSLDLINYNESDWKLLSGCPVLEVLYLVKRGFLKKDKEDLQKRVKFKICLPTLKRLTMFVLYNSAHPDYEFEINAPALEYFDVEGDIGNLVFLEKPSNLVEATLDIFTHEIYFEEKADYGDGVLGLLRQLYNAKKLKLRSSTTEWLHYAHDNYKLPMFHKLARLDFEIDCCNWGVLPQLLDHAPNLEVLDLNKFYCSLDSCSLYSHQVKPSDVPRSVSGLTTFCFRGFGGLENQLKVVRYILKKARGLTTYCFRGFEGLEDHLEVARYILKKARVLKTMTLTAAGNLQNSEEEKSRILEKLSTYPKLSMSCQIAFE